MPRHHVTVMASPLRKPATRLPLTARGRSRRAIWRDDFRRDHRLNRRAASLAARTSSVIDLYTWTTPNGRKASIALEELAIPYETHAVDIGKDEQFKPEFLKISPNNRIPAIVDRDNDFSLMESGAILIYLAEKAGKLLPADDLKRMRVIEWLMWQMGGIGPMLGQAHHFLKYNRGKAPYAEERYLKETQRLYGVLDRRLADREFVVDDYSIADISIWPWISRYEWQTIDLNAYPNVKRWYVAIANRPAVKKGYDVPKKVAGHPDAVTASSPHLEARLRPHVARSRCGQRRDEGTGGFAARRAGGNRGGVAGGVAERRRQRTEDADALGLQEFGNEGHGEIGLAAGDAGRRRDAAVLAHRLRGDHVGETEAREQIAQVDSGRAADRGIAERDARRRRERRLESLRRRDVGRRRAVTDRNPDRSAADIGTARRDDRTGFAERVDCGRRQDQDIGGLAGCEPRLQGAHRLEHDVGRLAGLIGERLCERLDGDMHRPRAEYFQHRSRTRREKLQTGTRAFTWSKAGSGAIRRGRSVSGGDPPGARASGRPDPGRNVRNRRNVRRVTCRIGSFRRLRAPKERARS